MRSIAAIILANIRKRKTQSILIALTIAVAALMFSSALSLMSSVHKPLESMYDKLNASHTLIWFDTKNYNPADIKKWWESRSEIKGVQSFKLHESNDGIIYKGEKLANSTIFFTERPGVQVTQDKLSFIEGKEAVSPEPGEIWITSNFAFKHNIKIGDKLGFTAKDGKVQMKVSAIVVDPQFSGTFMDLVRIWTAPGELDRLFGSNAGNEVIMGIRYSDYSKEPYSWKAFENHLDGSFYGRKVDYETISLTYLTMYTILGTILIVFSIVLIIIALFVIALTISSAVASDYKIIGVFISQGFTPKNIISIFTGQYALTALIAVPVGILGSWFTVRLVLDMLLRSIGFANFDFSMTLPAIVTFLIIMAAVGSSALIIARKAGKIKPVEAIREGSVSRKYSNGGKFNALRFKTLNVPAILGIKQIFSNRRQSAFILICAITVSSIFTFAVNVQNSLVHLSESPGYWGFDNRQVVMTPTENAGNLTDQIIMNKLDRDNRVKQATRVEIYDMTSVSEQVGKPSRNVIAMVYDGNMDALGLENIQGRNPKTENEISISLNLSKEYKKTIGDTIEVYIAKKKVSFVITGIMQSIMGAGYSIRIEASAIKKILPEYLPNQYAVVLKKGEDVNSFIKSYQNEYGLKLDVKSYEDNVKDMTNPIAIGGNSIVVILCIIFTLVMFLVIFNMTLMNVHWEKRNFGTYKAFGMTSSQIRLSLMLRTVIITVAGVIIGIPLGLYMAPGIMRMILDSFSIAKFPMEITLLGTAAVIPVCLLITLISTWIPSGRVLDISPRNLIVE